LNAIKSWSLSLFLLSVTLPGAAMAGDRLISCVDHSWYPFTFLASYKGGGLYVDMFHEAGERLDLTTRARAVPWGRCMEYIHNGEADAVIGISFKEERTSFLHYPTQPDGSPDYDYRLNTLDYVVVTMADQNYQYQGDPNTIPQPVRVPNGYSVGGALAEEGLDVDTSARNDRANLINLVTAGNGSAVMLRQLAQVMAEKEFFAGKLSISEMPYQSRRYFMAFSKQTDFSEEERWAVWNELKNVRDDTALMNTFLDAYSGK